MDTSTIPFNARLIRRKEVLRMIGVCNSQLYDMMAAGTFPRPVRLNPPHGRGVAWRGADIVEWMASLQAKEAA